MSKTALTKELDKRQRLSTLNMSLLSHFLSLDGQSLIRALLIHSSITNAMNKNIVLKNETNSQVI